MTLLTIGHLKRVKLSSLAKLSVYSRVLCLAQKSVVSV
jgi:hypothetical protein